MGKYIKITGKDKSPVVVLASNRVFYESRGAKIEEPTKKEIEQFFPEEIKTTSDETKKSLESATTALETEKTAHEETKKELSKSQDEIQALKGTISSEIANHGETKKSLESATTALEKANKALKNAEAEIKKLSKKE